MIVPSAIEVPAGMTRARQIRALEYMLLAGVPISSCLIAASLMRNGVPVVLWASHGRRSGPSWELRSWLPWTDGYKPTRV